jgi:aminomethyltransferase
MRPREELLLSDPEPRRSPLHEEHVAAGAVFTNFAGWHLPLKYGSELAEHAAVRTAAGLFDLCHMGEIVVLGPDAAAALDAALIGELSAVSVGQAKYTLLLDEDGGILDDLVVYRTGPDRFLVVANAANRALVAEELRRRVGDRAEVQDESDDVGLLALQGPLSRDVLLEMGGFAADGPDRTAAHFAELLTALPNYRFLAAELTGHPVLVARTGYTGELGYELFVAPGLLPALWRRILEVGRGSGVVPAGLAARDTLRLEAGMPLHGHELTAETRPAEVGLARLVPQRKQADYVGRAAVSEPPRRMLVGLAGDGRRAGRAGYPVLAGDRQVGVVTSGALSPTLGVPVAMASVEPDVAAPDTELEIDVRGTRLPTRVVPLPFYRRKADR